MHDMWMHGMYNLPYGDMYMHRHNLFLKTRLNSIACDCVTFTKKVKCVKLTSLLSLGYQMQFCNSFSPKYFISCKKGHKETTKNTNVKYL